MNQHNKNRIFWLKFSLELYPFSHLCMVLHIGVSDKDFAKMEKSNWKKVNVL